MKLWLITFFWVITTFAGTPAFCGITSVPVQNILFITEGHGAGENNVTWKRSDAFDAKVEPAYALGNGGISQGDFASASDALSAFAGLVPDGYVASVVSYLAGSGYDYCRLDWYYNFIDDADKGTPKAVYLPLLIYPDGRVRNMGMRVISVNPRILYYVYHPLAAPDLPPGLASEYPDGGILYKNILDQSLNLISSTTVETHGRYDPPQSTSNQPVVNPDQGLQSLISEVVVPEFTNYTASYAIVDYARNVQIAEDCDTSGNCIARITIDSSSRTVNTCNQQFPLMYSYQNVGTIIYTLQYTTDRYLVQPNGSFSYTATSNGYDAKSYPFRQVIPGNFPDPRLLAQIIIDPFGTNALYDYTNDTVNTLSCDHYTYAGSQCVQAPVGAGVNCN